VAAVFQGLIESGLGGGGGGVSVGWLLEVRVHEIDRVRAQVPFGAIRVEITVPGTRTPSVG